MLSCKDCNKAFNNELISDYVNPKCPHCMSASIGESRGIELGHAFLLGTRYTSVFRAAVKHFDGHSDPIPMQMGCYGIGVSRLVAAIAENRHDKAGLCWPSSVSPYRCVITGGQDLASSLPAIESLYQELDSASLCGAKGSILLDDRAHLSFSWRLKDAQLIGIPLIIVVGKRYHGEGLYEVYERQVNQKLSPLFLTKEALLGFFQAQKLANRQSVEIAGLI